MSTKILKFTFLTSVLVIAFIFMTYERCQSQSCDDFMKADKASKKENSEMTDKSKQELKNRLTPLQFEVTQNKGTERPGTGEYYHFNEDGVYKCVVCGNELFDSETKYDSGSGWPSFYAPITDEQVGEHEDNSFGMSRVEVTCNKCGAHLGHVFTDGPQPTGLRYCVNSAALQFDDEKDDKNSGEDKDKKEAEPK